MTEEAQTGMTGVVPHLVCSNAANAIAFYKKAFGAEEAMRLPSDDGRIMHACLMINGGPVMLCDEFETCNTSPNSLKGTAVTLHLTVEDADRTFEQAVGAGATAVMPVSDMFWGDRYGVLEDPFGHRWAVATPQRQLSADEIREAARVAMGTPAEAGS